MLKNCWQLSFVCLFFVTGISVKVYSSFKLHLSCMLFLVTLSLWRWENVTRKEELPRFCSSWSSAPQNSDQSCSATSVSYITAPIFILHVITTTTTTTTIIIIIIIISFMQGIYTYVPETNYVPREYGVAAILLLLFMVLISLVSVLNLLYFYISTFLIMWSSVQYGCFL